MSQQQAEDWLGWSIEFEDDGGCVIIALSTRYDDVPADSAALLMQGVIIGLILDGEASGWWTRPPEWASLPSPPPGTFRWDYFAPMDMRVGQFGEVRVALRGELLACRGLLLSGFNGLHDGSCQPSIGLDEGRYVDFVPTAPGGDA